MILHEMSIVHKYLEKKEEKKKTKNFFRLKLF